MTQAALRAAILLLVAPLLANPQNQARGARDAAAFAEAAEKRLLELWIKESRASWVQSNFITDDTEKMAAEAKKDVIAATTELAVAATRFDGLALPYDVARKLKLLKLSLTLPAPRNPAEQTELTEIAASLESDYGKGKFCPDTPE